MTGKRALFLDRDGVINVDHGYVHKPENFQFVDGIFELCAAARQRDYLLIVVTNQAGIGRGYYSEAQFHALTDWMNAQFLARCIEIARVYFCPYHPEHGIGAYKRDSPMRKPNPGMILAAGQDFSFDLSACALVGDSITDMQAGRQAGIVRNYLFNPAHIRVAGCTSVASLRELVDLL